MVAGQKKPLTSGEGLGQLLHCGSLPRRRQLWLYLPQPQLLLSPSAGAEVAGPGLLPSTGAVEQEEEVLVHRLRTKIIRRTKTIHGRKPCPSTKVSLSARSPENP